MRASNEITGIQKPNLFCANQISETNFNIRRLRLYDKIKIKILRNYKLGQLQIVHKYHFKVCNFYVDFKSKMAVAAAQSVNIKTPLKRY